MILEEKDYLRREEKRWDDIRRKGISKKRRDELILEEKDYLRRKEMSWY